MNVFVLCTGRCGSLTFSKACSHVTQFSSGHETRHAYVGEARLSYPKNHIEIDNRLSWHLGELGKRFPNAYWVHLWRDRQQTAQSFMKRWNRGIIKAFSQGILTQKASASSTKLEQCLYYVDTVNSNIREFLSSREHLDFPLDEAQKLWPLFWLRISAEGDYQKSLGEWKQRYNKS